MIKRLFDVTFSMIGLILLSPIFLITALLIKIDSQGPVFFKQERIGRRFRPFLIYKFRSMVEDAPKIGSPITFGRDFRITRVGQILRYTKIDEIPQLINVLKGDMSFVGPRPEVKCYVEMFYNDYKKILEVRPGITDLASLKYHNESAYLGKFRDPQKAYIDIVLPEKISLAKEYVSKSSFFFDLTLILKTLGKLITD